MIVAAPSRPRRARAAARWRRWRALAAGGFVAASQFTLWPDAAGEPMISPHPGCGLSCGAAISPRPGHPACRAGRPGRRGRLEGCLFGLLQYAAGLGAAARRHRARGHLRHRDQRRRGQHGARRTCGITTSPCWPTAAPRRRRRCTTPRWPICAVWRTCAPAGLHRGNRPMNGPDAQPAPELSLPVLIIGGGAAADRRHPAGAVGRGMRGDRA